ncbi:hypothetical protein LZF95_23710 [Algoriphagus sp. AGSA1]|uniref:hypothetical protein n=1 Tax=Algoriphagus sp. AGSA1 TaxID=2907213 RepID=UPI001F27FA06|nr:hypothetical protein [Algoriphagus sp. AGSA1]MCE7057710.1 hypothetical protein [Algoriphagus sp. AGSA1]
MPDIRISLEPEKMYHIWTHASGSENLFRSEENYRYFLEKYTHYIYPVAETFAYCLMPNHLHLMVRFRALDELKNLQGFQNLEGLETEVERFLSRQFSNLFNAYTKAYNKMYDRRGNLFIPRFKRKLIDSDSYFTALIAYIHNNPVHHEFVSDPTDWPHSSWHSYLMSKPTKVSRQEGIDWFGGAEAFITFHRQQKNREVILLFED